MNGAKTKNRFRRILWNFQDLKGACFSKRNHSSKSQVEREVAKEEWFEGQPNDVEHAPGGRAWANASFVPSQSTCCIIKKINTHSPREVRREIEYKTVNTKIKYGKNDDDTISSSHMASR